MRLERRLGRSHQPRRVIWPNKPALFAAMGGGATDDGIENGTIYSPPRPESRRSREQTLCVHVQPVAVKFEAWFVDSRTGHHIVAGHAGQVGGFHPRLTFVAPTLRRADIRASRVVFSQMHLNGNVRPAGHHNVSNQATSHHHPSDIFRLP